MIPLSLISATRRSAVTVGAAAVTVGAAAVTVGGAARPVGPSGTGVSRISNARPAAAAPSMLAWNWAPTARSGRNASGVSSSTSSAVS